MLRACVHTDYYVGHHNPDTCHLLLGHPLVVHDDGNLHNLDTCSVVVVAYCCGMCFGDGVGVVGQVVDGGGCGGGLVYLAQIRKSIDY